ncbi:hypothetical protein KSP39_PZI001562 [Platanthera zijinensis]|uniref:Uncharacterized protein n=1 Tax=Platanthera zijinensis TaxID=2320716 RepID=A0AAP0GFF5_9ASPA
MIGESLPAPHCPLAPSSGSSNPAHPASTPPLEGPTTFDNPYPTTFPASSVDSTFCCVSVTYPDSLLFISPSESLIAPPSLTVANPKPTTSVNPNLLLSTETQSTYYHLQTSVDRSH